MSICTLLLFVLYALTHKFVVYNQVKVIKLNDEEI